MNSTHPAAGAADTRLRGDVDTPSCFRHEVDPDLLAPDRLDDLVREADARRKLTVQYSDEAVERKVQRPRYTEPRYPVLDDARERSVQYRINDTHEWAGLPYARTYTDLVERYQPDPSAGHILRETVIRVFSPGALVALHGDPDAKIVCAVTGHTRWHARRREAMSVRQHENLLRGEFFLRWSDADETLLELGPGDGCYVPDRWAHWLDHPSDTPATSFEIGFYTRDSLRDRKVYDVNWMLRRAHLDPRPPTHGADGVKCRVWDAMTYVRGRGGEYRGAS